MYGGDKLLTLGQNLDLFKVRSYTLTMVPKIITSLVCNSKSTTAITNLQPHVTFYAKL